MKTVYMIATCDGRKIVFSTIEAAAQARARLEELGDYDCVVEPLAVLEEAPPPVLWHMKECFRGSIGELSFLVAGWDTSARRYVGTFEDGLGFGAWDGNYRFWGTDRARVHAAFDAHHAICSA